LSTTHWIELAVAAIALAIVALSSWVETCLSAASRVNIRRLLDERFARIEEQEFERNQHLRSAMLLIELLSGAVAAALITHVIAVNLSQSGVLVGVIVSLLALIVLGRIWPKVAAGAEPDAESPRVARLARVLNFIFAPVARPTQWITDLFSGGDTRSNGHDDDVEPSDEGTGAPPVSEREREREPDEIEEGEQEMISGVLHLERATARDIMVPRIDIVAVGQDVLIGEAVDVAIQAGHSRIPVYARNIDEIIGVIYAKDLLRFVNDEHDGVTIVGLTREAYFVPESKRVDDLLNEMQQAKVHLAVVVDEYGGTAGVVTIEDILEEIVGEIQDEYDSEQPRIEIISPHEAIADGALMVDDLSSELDLDWPEPVSGTVGGLIQRRLGRIPTEGAVVELKDIRLTVEKVERRRVRQVRIERVAPQALTAEDLAKIASADSVG